jgi:uncharacterized membrane protein
MNLLYMVSQPNLFVGFIILAILLFFLVCFVIYLSIGYIRQIASFQGGNIRYSLGYVVGKKYIPAYKKHDIKILSDQWGEYYTDPLYQLTIESHGLYDTIEVDRQKYVQYQIGDSIRIRCSFGRNNDFMKLNSIV